MGSGPTRFKKREIARIIEGVKATGARGTFEFQLDVGVIKFHMGAESGPGSVLTDESPNPWDKVLHDGKTKPALTVLKKVP
jgi:hypothetical protein